MISLVIACSLGFPSTMLILQRDRLSSGAFYQDPSIQKIDDWTFWFFISGIFKDRGTDRQNTFYFTMGALILALVFEKQCINWLTNRWGCTYNNFQKFVEIEIRKKYIDQNWEGKVPAYDINQYRHHYFFKDFNDLAVRFLETAEERYANTKAALKGKKAKKPVEQELDVNDPHFVSKVEMDSREKL